MEIWKDIDWIDSVHRYQISNLGNIRRTQKNGEWCYSQPFKDEKGYMNIYLTYQPYKTHKYKIHRLIAQAFIPNPDNKPEIDHINTIKDDNRIENLRWVTSKENSNNPISRAKHSKAMREHNPFKGRHHTDSCKKINSDKHSKQLYQVTIDNIIVGIWRNMRDAAKYYGCSYSTIHKAISRNNDTAVGYRWLYADDYWYIWQRPLQFDWEQITERQSHLY